jgi:hypothetical protein
LRHPSFPGESFPWPSLSLTLARRFISIMKGVRTGELPKYMLRLVLLSNSSFFSRSADVSIYATGLIRSGLPPHAMDFCAISGVSSRTCVPSITIRRFICTMFPSGFR